MKLTKLTKPKVLQVLGMLIWCIYILVPTGVVKPSLPFYLVTGTPGIILILYGSWLEYIRSKMGPSVEHEGVPFRYLYPRATQNIVSMLLLGGVLCMGILRDHRTLLSAVNAANMTLILVYLLILIERRFFAKLTVTFGTDFIFSSYNNRFEISQIQCIYMSHQKIGIKLKDKRLVPVELCFYFHQNQEAAGLKELYDWAERNHVEMRCKSFVTIL